MIATTLSDCFECDDLSGLQDNVTILNMTFNRFEHPVFEESITMDWTTLTVNIGGIFALWLGMSVMSIFDFCYYLFRVARHYVRKLISKRRMKTSRIESNISMTALDNYNNNYEKSDSISSRSNSVAIDNPSAAISEKIYQRAMEILSSTGLSPLESETFLKSPTGHLALLAADQNDDKNLFFMILSCFGSLQKQLRELQAERLPVKTEPQLEKDSESINQHR